jgi:serine/threonine protein phosphatase PrpC
MTMTTEIPGVSSRNFQIWNERTSPLSNHIPEIEISGLSVVGPVREDNQDSIHLPDLENPAGLGLLFALADGMGGYSHGGLASLMAVNTLSDVFITHNHNAPVRQVLRHGVERANLAVYQKAQQLGAGRMGTTLTAACLTGNILHLAHVGDSRAYLIRKGQAVCLSSDHTVVGDMVRSKLLSPDKIRTHAQRSILTKAIGVSLFVQPDITQHRLHDGDRLILCSDGVWSVIPDDDFARIGSESVSTKSITERLIDTAIRNDTDDNASVVTLQITRLASAPDVPKGAQRPRSNWLDHLRKRVS